MPVVPSHASIAKRVALVACTALMIVIARPAPGQAPDSGALAVRVPRAIGTFQLIGRKNFDQPQLGFLLRYQRADGLWVDLFVYPGPDLASKCGIDCARDVLQREGDEFIDGFPEFVRRHYVDSIAVLSDGALEPPAGAPWRLGRRIHALQFRNGHDEWSDLYLYYVPGYRVKVRASYAADSVLAVAVDSFAVAAPPTLADTSGKIATADGKESHGIAITAVLQGAPAAHFAGIASLLAQQGYTIADSSGVAGRLVTGPRYEWPAGTESESWHGSQSPGVRLTVRLTAVGDSTRVEMLGESPTRAGWSDAKVAEMMRMLSVMQLASELSKTRQGGEARKPQR